jgi:hypothetical protein
MDFINWWLEEHFIISTIITPALSLAWSFYKGLFIRGIISGFLVCMVLYSVLNGHRHED